ncbi:hypothetical protein NUW54_g5942 [Trametes sanguinea]|uniref:Uncharacterized protein n=1 Tax=Trametes sanguinea TaxID=158606 RepID=A0ACC1PWY5_9APHY|nr:hypothetical protein NUW54_g5942 [Trametes sanguinea]
MGMALSAARTLPTSFVAAIIIVSAFDHRYASQLCTTSILHLALSLAVSSSRTFTPFTPPTTPYIAHTPLDAFLTTFLRTYSRMHPHLTNPQVSSTTTMSHSPTPPACESGSPRTASSALSELQRLLSAVALPKSKNAKSVSVPLATFHHILELTNAATTAVQHELSSPTTSIAALATKLNSLAEQLAQTSRQQVRTYAQVAAQESIKPEPGAPLPNPPRSVPPASDRPPRFDFILRQLDHKHPVLAHDTPADIQRTINDIIIQSGLHCGNDYVPADKRVFPHVQAVAKLRNGNIRLMWRDQGECNTARLNEEVWLPRLSDQLEVLWPSYRVVVHGVPTSLRFDTDIHFEETARTIIRE